jgi:uncharacterized FlgJ-related protein|tara:strand:+ start:420 stop:656 length:237 start_codon:yes stop_codon:yes gene_type:complete
MNIKTLPSKNEMFEEYNKLKSYDEKIEYVKSLRDMDMYNTLKLEYDNIITKLYSDKQSQEVEEDQGVWSEFAEEGLLQ